MNRSLSALVVVLGAASLLAACASGGAATAPTTQVSASHLVSPATSPIPSPPSASLPPTPIPPAATAIPSPSALPGPTYVPAPQPSLALPAAGAPAMPTSSRLDFPGDVCTTLRPDEPCERLHVAWQEANPAGVTIRVYALTVCLHAATASKPSSRCLRDGDTIPTGALVLLGTAPASALSFSFVLGIGETMALGWLPGFGPDVDGVVLQAVNRHGGSQFAIVGSAGSCWGCTL
jgi:hypothetical protein